MSDEDLQHYHRVLTTLRRELAATLEASRENTVPVSPDAAIGRLSRQDAMQSQQMALELQRRSQQRLAQIDAALKPIVEGTFGFCLRCEEEIGAARLKVKPEAHLCVRCAH
jgi:DnaK suppressor protein